MTCILKMFLSEWWNALFATPPNPDLCPSCYGRGFSEKIFIVDGTDHFVKQKCKPCDGTGKLVIELFSCPFCKGSGAQLVTLTTGCEDCHNPDCKCCGGEGYITPAKVLSEKCVGCEGKGKVTIVVDKLNPNDE